MLPIGIRFHPQNEDIILHYLYNKLRDESFSLNPIIECEIYGENAGEWKRQFEESGEKYHYFFTKLVKKTSNGKRLERRTAGGTWKGQNDEKIFIKQGKQDQHIGSVRRFTFARKNGSDEQQRWAMLEFRIDGEALKHIQDEDYVICLIKRKKNKNIHEAPLPIASQPNFCVENNNSINATENIHNALVGRGAPGDRY